MERRDFLKIAFGMAAGAVVTATAAQAMTPMLSPLAKAPPIPEAEAKPAVATAQDIEEAKIEKVRWHHRRWHRHHWHRRRHWGWHRRRHWRHRHWRRRRYYW
jgi:hypothetical protein